MTVRSIGREASPSESKRLRALLTMSDTFTSCRSNYKGRDSTGSIFTRMKGMGEGERDHDQYTVRIGSAAPTLRGASDL